MNKEDLIQFWEDANHFQTRFSDFDINDFVDKWTKDFQGQEGKQIFDKTIATIYVLQDEDDGDLFCAFEDEEVAEIEANESGAVCKSIKLHYK